MEKLIDSKNFAEIVVNGFVRITTPEKSDKKDIYKY